MQFRKFGFVNFFHITIAVVTRVYTIAESLVIILNELWRTGNVVVSRWRDWFRCGE